MRTLRALMLLGVVTLLCAVLWEAAGADAAIQVGDADYGSEVTADGDDEDEEMWKKRPPVKKARAGRKARRDAAKKKAARKAKKNKTKGGAADGGGGFDLNNIDMGAMMGNSGMSPMMFATLHAPETPRRNYERSVAGRWHDELMGAHIRTTIDRTADLRLIVYVQEKKDIFTVKNYVMEQPELSVLDWNQQKYTPGDAPAPRDEL